MVHERGAFCAAKASQEWRRDEALLFLPHHSHHVSSIKRTTSRAKDPRRVCLQGRRNFRIRLLRSYRLAAARNRECMRSSASLPAQLTQSAVHSTQLIPTLYLPSSSIVWNGTPISGREGLIQLVATLPGSKHELHAFDAHPLGGGVENGEYCRTHCCAQFGGEYRCMGAYGEWAALWFHGSRGVAFRFAGVAARGRAEHVGQPSALFADTVHSYTALYCGIVKSTE